MTQDVPDSFDDFLAQVSASLTSASGEAALRLINAQRNLRLALDEIVQQRHDLQIRVISDNRISGDAGADILMQIDDYEIRVEIVDAPDLMPTLTLENLKNYRQLIEDNPSTEALVITWTSDELLSQQLSLSTIDYLVKNSEKINDFVLTARPLSDVVQEILVRQMQVWDDIPSLGVQENGISTDVSEIFLKHFANELDSEKERSFKIEEKKLAIRQFPEKRETDNLKSILEDALNEHSAEELAIRLAQLPKAGSK
jgi:hypothetical protein